ncbi:uncharacterized protein G2W53_024179 [Senna tora]|uniref:Uncharacterized protein n=1 Tax=Senna tora TaxID=362788 RepID=A0A834TBV3_9FABA|nr:uncharacterized protein G2W53_024179 [Senna tora]
MEKSDIEVKKKEVSREGKGVHHV